MDKVPKPVVVNTGEQSRVSKTIDDFFGETITWAILKPGVRLMNFEIKSGELSYNLGQVSDDRVTQLKYGDFVLASVFETRTESNYVNYTFFRNLEGFDEYLTG